MEPIKFREAVKDDCDSIISLFKEMAVEERYPLNQITTTKTTLMRDCFTSKNSTFRMPTHRHSNIAMARVQEFFNPIIRNLITRIEPSLKAAENKWLNIVVAEEGGHPVALACYYHSYSTWSGRTMRVDNMYIKPDYRHIGIGPQLLKEVARHAIKEQCVQLNWNVAANSPAAERFCEHVGGEIESTWQTCRLRGDKLKEFARR